MKVKQQTCSFIALAALFAIFGAVLNLWFYTVAGFAIALWVGGRFLIFRSLVGGIVLKIDRTARTHIEQQRIHTEIDVAVSANVRVEGCFKEIIPDDVVLVEGESSADLALSETDRAALHYVLTARGKADIRLERSTFTVENDFFRQTLQLSTPPLEVKQSTSVLTVEGGDYASDGTRTDIRSTSLADLHRASTAGRDMEFMHIRPYDPGDPMKRIHWKASARLNQLMTKDFVSELDGIVKDEVGPLDGIVTEPGAVLNLVIDQSRRMALGALGQTELDFAVNVASYLVGRAVKTGLYTGLVTYDEGGVVTDVAPDASLAHSSRLVTALNTIMARATHERQRGAKTGIVGTEAHQLKKHAKMVDVQEEADSGHFRELIAYLYEHEEGYRDAVGHAPAFRALATSAVRSSCASVIVVISNLEGDIDPLMEGLLLATGRGLPVYVVSIFSQVFKPFYDRLVAAEELYASYEKYQMRVNRLKTIRNVKVIPADSPAYLSAYIKRSALETRVHAHR